MILYHLKSKDKVLNVIHLDVFALEETINRYIEKYGTPANLNLEVREPTKQELDDLTPPDHNS